VAQWLLITSVIFLASTRQSMTGFGFAVLAVPLLVPLLPPRHAVALVSAIFQFPPVTRSVIMIIV
jgi:uncharacterized membrane protein YfcA